MPPYLSPDQRAMMMRRMRRQRIRKRTKKRTGTAVGTAVRTAVRTAKAAKTGRAVRTANEAEVGTAEIRRARIGKAAGVVIDEIAIETVIGIEEKVETVTEIGTETEIGIVTEEMIEVVIEIVIEIAAEIVAETKGLAPGEGAVVGLCRTSFVLTAVKIKLDAMTEMRHRRLHQLILQLMRRGKSPSGVRKIRWLLQASQTG
mmetsp:Transcript_21380/g.38387  ORF Transcript_21380/g.38387 Transcript_21380/m.38387 type:complete len:202 (+) Transcript_21380:210-815(+)